MSCREREQQKSADVRRKISHHQIERFDENLSRIRAELAGLRDGKCGTAKGLAHNESADSLMHSSQSGDELSIDSSFSYDLTSGSASGCNSTASSLLLEDEHHHHEEENLNLTQTKHSNPPQPTPTPPTPPTVTKLNNRDGAQAATPRRSRSLVDDAKLDTARNRQLLDEIRSEAAAETRRPSECAQSSLGQALATKAPVIFEEELPAGDGAQATGPETGTEGGTKTEAKCADLLEEAQEIERCLIDFPRHISDLDHCNHLLIKYEPELDPTHPGFHDLEYRARRKEVAEVAFNYRFGEKIPEIRYSDKELATWRTIYLRLKEAYAKYACKQHNSAIQQLEAERVYSPDEIPQLQRVSEFLERRTGWRLRPVAGLLSARDFLASLAFRVFQTTQYIRHWGNPEHSVEPDCIHELMGHIPMLCDPEFAQFSQELGLASLGASDEQIEKFATLYWFTVEFGLCKERGSSALKCYGAGLLSSYGEMEHALESGKPKLREFVPEETAMETYDDSEYQVVYYVASSFEEAKAKIKAYATNHLEREFELAYDPYSNSIRELSSHDQLEVYANSIKCDINRLASAISKLRAASAGEAAAGATEPSPEPLR